MNEQTMHSLLIEEAAKWLQKKCTVVITDMTTAAGETPDAIGWKGWTSTLIECKASRADFHADKMKPFRREPERGMGNLRYFCAPQGMLKAEEMPEGWGLLEWTGKKIIETAKANPQQRTGLGWQDGRNYELELLLSAMRRIGNAAPKGVSVKCYTYESNNRATLGVVCDHPSARAA